MKITIIATAFAFSVELFGGQVVGRVVHATPETLRLEVGPETKNYRLAGISQIEPLSDEWQARIASRLQKELVGKFVMLEEDGLSWVAFRSPDALDINQWLVSDGLAATAGDCRACPTLRRLQLRARTTGQGWWSTGNTISAVILGDYELLGEANPAGRAAAPQTSSKPKASPAGKPNGTGRGRKK